MVVVCEVVIGVAVRKVFGVHCSFCSCAPQLRKVGYCVFGVVGWEESECWNKLAQ